MGPYSYSDDNHELRIPRFYKSPAPNVSLPAWLGLGAIAVALIALTAVLVLRLERQSLSALQHTYVVIISSLDMLSNLQDAHVRAREYILTGQPLYLERYKHSREAVIEEFSSAPINWRGTIHRNRKRFTGSKVSFSSSWANSRRPLIRAVLSGSTPLVP